MASNQKNDPMAKFLAKVAEFETNKGIAKGLGEVFDGAISDIRHRLITEGWFGRHMPEHGENLWEKGSEKGSMAEQAGWVVPATTDQKAAAWDALCDKLAKERGHQPEHAHEQDQDLDR